MTKRRVDRVADCARLESECTGDSTEGSNPSPSATQLEAALTDLKMERNFAQMKADKHLDAVLQLRLDIKGYTYKINKLKRQLNEVSKKDEGRRS